jgi:hypothetical protein
MINFSPKSPKSLSAAWFAFVAYVVVVIIFRRWPAPGPFYFFIWQIVPIIIGGLLGFILGAQILISGKVRKPIEAVVIGIKVSVITYFTSSLIAYVVIMIDSIIADHELRLGWQIYSFFYVTFYFGWLIIVVGAAAGWLLSLLHQKFITE